MQKQNKEYYDNNIVNRKNIQFIVIDEIFNVKYTYTILIIIIMNNV